MLAIFSGILISVATGFIENPPNASIIGARYYGYPLAWRVIMIVLPSPLQYKFILSNLICDVIIWAGLFYVIPFIFHKYREKSGWSLLNKRSIIALTLVIPLGLMMDLVHELGHALWGTIVGGKLTYMQVAFLELYPRIAVTSDFVLGLVRIEGLSGFNFGFFLLGGAFTTNIVSWLVGLFLLRRKLVGNTRICLRVFGLFGLLDLPLYVILPQLGFRHWFLVGGTQPEPLIGARMMGISDPIFYVFVVLTSVGLMSLYYQPIRSHIQGTLLRFRQILSSENHVNQLAVFRYTGKKK
jgi:hypothetical protein